MDLPAPVSPVSTVKPAVELELEFGDDDQVAQDRRRSMAGAVRQTQKRRPVSQTTPSYQRSLRRSVA
jgi:hypothetical protein